MGGVLDGGFGIGIKTSPSQAAIEKAQAELRSYWCCSVSVLSNLCSPNSSLQQKMNFHRM